MKVLSERFAEDFLEKGGFRVVPRAFSRSKFGLRKALSKVGVPFVLKASGKSLSYSGSDGVKPHIKTYTHALIEMKNLKKIKGTDGVLVQKKIHGKEFFVGIRRGENRRYSISFGCFMKNSSGEKEVVLKIFPAVKKSVKEIIEEVGKYEKISRKEKATIEKFVLDLIRFSKKNKGISEVKVSSLIVDGKHATVANAEVVFN